MRLFVFFFLLFGCQEQLPVWEQELDFKVFDYKTSDPPPQDSHAVFQREVTEQGCFGVFPDRELHNIICRNIGKTNECLITCEDIRNTEVLKVWGRNFHKSRITDISNLEGIEEFRNLKELLIGGGKYKDLSPIAKLHQLEKLSIGENGELSDIRPIRNLVGLKDLYIYSNPLVKTISPLEGLERLEFLRLGLSEISDLRPLRNLRKLNLLEIIGSQLIEDISPLTNLSEIKLLWLQNNNLKDIDPLRELSKIEALVLDNNPIENILPLLELERLRELGISGIPKTQINCEVIDQLTKNENVYMNHSDLCH